MLTLPRPATAWKSQIAHITAANTFVGTPNLVKRTNGELWAAHDLFGSATDQDETRIYKSTDSGSSWSHVRTLTGLFWPTLIEYGGNFYIFGTTTEYGNFVLGKSTDNFATTPTLNTVFAGSYHKSATATLQKDGYLLVGLEDTGGGGSWPEHFRSVIAWGNLADLTNAANWGKTSPLTYNQNWNLANWQANNSGWLEGNVVEHNGTVYNLLRVNNGYESAAGIVTVNWDGETPANTTLSFDDSIDILQGFPGGSVKFHPLWDSESSKWVILSNYHPHPHNSDPNKVRSQLWLCSSSDMRTWTPHRQILGDTRTVTAGGGNSKVGWQYVSPLIDGDDLIFASRTSWDGAPNEHDANRLTFHRIHDFRGLLA